MKFSLILAALVATVAAIPTPLKHHAADQGFLQKQKDVIHLLDQITQQIPHEQYYNLGVNYDIEQNFGEYDEPAIVKYYVGLVKQGHVQPKGTAFSTSVSILRKEVALLTRILLSAKSYGVFLKTAAWARVHVNEGQFVKAFISALLQHPETEGVIPPALYEILPQHYFDARVIHEAQNIKIVGVENPLADQTVVIPVNYTDSLPGGEWDVSYFTQDIGLAQYYAYVALAGYMVPQHLGQGQSHEQGEHIGRGSIYYYLHQQLLAHYNLQRLASGLGPIEEISFDHIKTPYQPYVSSINGLEFTGRSQDIHLAPYHQDLVKNVHLLEQRLVHAIDTGFVITPQQDFLSLYQPQGLNILGELIEGSGKSVNPRYYGSLQAAARQLLGNAPHFNDIWQYTPAALDVYETAVRDPAFYQLYKRVIKLFQRYQESLPAHQYNDLHLPGVSIDKIIFPDLKTYFEYQIVDLDNGIVQPVNKVEQDNLKVKAQVQRLNHQAYEYQVIVHSEKPITNAVVRVYLGPKYDYNGKPVDINHHRHYFVELDQFVHNLHEGKNVIVRDSQYAPHFSHDYPSVHHMEAYIDSAVRSQNPYYVTEYYQIFGFPSRLSIPKGHHGGFPLQVLVIISGPGVTPVSYGPVIPAEYQTYQSNQYHVVEEQQYNNVVQGLGQPGHHYAADVVPHWHQQGVYGKDVEKMNYYYGHYLYHKYQHQYPIHHYQQGGAGYGYQYGGQYQGQVHHAQGQGQQFQGVQGQGVYGQGVHGQGVHGQGVNQYQKYTQVPIQGQIVHGGHQGVYQGEGVQTGYQQVHGQAHEQHYGHLAGGVTNVEGVEGVQHYAYPQGGQQNVNQHNVEYLRNYYEDKHISQIIGGAISLDNRPLGYPLDRPLAPSAFYVSNMQVVDVMVYHDDQYHGVH